MSTMSRKLIEAWSKEVAERANRCCHRSDGYEEQVESLVLAKLQAAMQYAYADASYLCDQMFNRASDADECADAIRERAKEILK
jgi:hypothetical protein